ncbi:sulfite exporter TauE/SafE family protein [Chelatococcus sambhunathii]|uniref:Probable membrane transporter protein n=1 Tax=Chelatococcus sambhunathii TaxID=363953 RepID=A0ABU1DF65_9HYPH|nr:sulfite exporter TauE/SafE family protein [Chelatococcus sambhunathii]MDR4306764.1 sulfite exporter TauE/SafE family protein [Chelatococcus sambhunathii]
MQIYLPIAELPVDVLLVLAMSLAVGFVSGMFGVGGGFLMTPLLIFIGVPTAVAVASEAPQIAASAFTGVLAYWRRRAIDFKLSAVLLAGGVVGSAGGVAFFNALRASGQLDAFIAISYVLMLGTIGGLMLVESVRSNLDVAPKPRPRRPPTRRFFDRFPLKLRFRRSMIHASAISLAGLGAFIGFAGAVLGVGGGFLLVPALVYVFRVPTAVVVGTSLFQILVTMLASTVMHATTNASVDIVLAILLMIGGSIGSQFGVRVGQKLSGPRLRLLLAVMLLVVAGRFLADLVIEPDEPFSISQTERA